MAGRDERSRASTQEHVDVLLEQDLIQDGGLRLVAGYRMRTEQLHTDVLPAHDRQTKPAYGTEASMTGPSARGGSQQVTTVPPPS